ncbi:podocalyxin-like protein 2 [Thalassophryne amazonica]|uniref:podocalyxin-like protein 2 n=1 Tax=Thalassophryne amazonica TaxID=390379 RepID=UPI001471FAC3|nr:podocalyxin-like protein 2 [Thalassophryne amazonica]
MSGLLLVSALTALLCSSDAFRLGSSQRVMPLRPSVAHRVQDEDPVHPQFIQDLIRTKRHSMQELVRVQPNLVHDMGWPEIHETSRSEPQVESVNISLVDPAPPSGSQSNTENLEEEEEEMERMVHLALPQDARNYLGQMDSTDSETELLGGPGAGDASLEASAFYGTDSEDKDRGEEGGEDKERRGGDNREGEGEREAEMDKFQDVLQVNHTTPDLDVLIGYSPSVQAFSSSLFGLSSPAQVHVSGLQEQRAAPVLEVSPFEKDQWEAAREEDGQSSGFDILQSSISSPSTALPTNTATTAGTATGGETVGTSTPETDTGTDFGLLGNYAKEDTADEQRELEEEEDDTGLTHIGGVFTQNPTAPDVGVAPSREPLQPSVEEEDELDGGDMFGGGENENRDQTRSRHIVPLTTDPSPTIGFTDSSWDGQEKTTPLQAQRSEVSGSGVTEFIIPNTDFDEMEEVRQVVCVDWTELRRGFVILNMTQNMNCEEFRVDRGVRLLRTMERVFARRMNSPEGSWVIYLSKPTHQQPQLFMNVASEQGVIPTKEVLDMLGEIRNGLNKMGIQNFSAANTCQSRPSQTRSDYGKLFVVLVIIGSVCMVIITTGFIYICWQRRLPVAKTTFRSEELHFVKNGWHDNPTLDVTNNGHPEMKEKKPSADGLTGKAEGGGEDSSRWQVFVNEAATEEEDEEQDTHL